MAQQATTAAESANHDHTKHYVKVWAILLVLLIVSVLGPLVGIQILTLITAFGIALVKAYLVAKNFMHLDIERRYVVYLLITCVVLMLLFFAGTAPDVMRHSGHQWQNLAAQAEVKRVLEGASTPQAPRAVLTPELAFTTVCSTCHGAEGNGAGPAGAALSTKPANFRDPEFWASRDRDHIAKVIANGGASVGRSPLMPAFGGQFDPNAALALADYLIARFRPEGAAAQPQAADAGTALPPSPGTHELPAAAE